MAPKFLVALFLAACVSAIAAPARLSRASELAGPRPIHAGLTRIPCAPGLQPDRLVVTWNIGPLDGPRRTGKKLLLHGAKLTSLYRSMCGTVLIQPGVCAGRNVGPGTITATYRLRFLRRSRTLLGIYEVDDAACLPEGWVVGRKELGVFVDLILPKGVPEPPY